MISHNYDHAYQHAVSPLTQYEALGEIGSGMAPKSTATPVRNQMSDVTREEIDAKIGASEARTGTTIANVMGALNLLSAKLDGLAAGMVEFRSEARADNHSVKATLLTSAITLFLGLGALIVGIAFGLPTIYGLGTQTREIVRDEVHAAMPVTNPTPPVR